MESELPIDLDEAFVFPTPPRINTLFHSGRPGGPSPSLAAVSKRRNRGSSYIDAEDFEGALAIGNVALKKLTQALFLINADSFLPIDDHTTSLGLFRFDKPPNRVTLPEYADLIHLLRNAFPGCRLVRDQFVRLFCGRPALAVRPANCFQVSTNVYHDDAEDYWPEFDNGNHVFTGGPGQNYQYPLGKPEPGDVVLVRFGRRDGRGIGVVYRNDYQDEGWAEHRKLACPLAEQDIRKSPRKRDRSSASRKQALGHGTHFGTPMPTHRRSSYSSGFPRLKQKKAQQVRPWNIRVTEFCTDHRVLARPGTPSTRRSRFVAGYGGPRRDRTRTI